MADEELERIKRKKLQEMMDSQARSQIGVAELGTPDFDAAVSKGLTLVDFWAEWCGPCRSMHPVFERMAKKYPGIRFARVNVDAAREIAQRYGVQSIPTFIMFRDGIEADRMTGAVGEPGIHMIAKKHLPAE